MKTFLRRLGYAAAFLFGWIFSFLLIPVFTGRNPCAYHEPINRELGPVVKIFFGHDGMGHPEPRFWLILLCAASSVLAYHSWLRRRSAKAPDPS